MSRGGMPDGDGWIDRWGVDMRKKILVVDDETDFLTMLKMRLEANRYTVLTAGSGEEGLLKSQSESPGLILLDVMMPGMDGFRVLRRLKENDQTRAIPVIMLTAKGDTKSIMEAQNHNVADYLIKPIESADLLALVRKYL